MQRRAAAAFVAFFLVVGGLSLSLIVTADAPELDVKGKQLQQGDTFTVSGTTYTVTKVEATKTSGGGHGGGGGISYTAKFQWTNESARYTATWKNDTTVTVDNQTWRVLVAQGESPTTFTLREVINETAILKEDPNAADELVTHNGTQYVVVRQDGDKELVPYDEYFPDPATRTYETGDTIQYKGQKTTVAKVTSDAVTLEWFAPKTNTITVGQKGTITLDGTRYFAYFPSTQGKTVILSSNFDALQNFNQELHEFHEQKNGLWGISILSGLGAFLLLGIAYLPSRY